MTDNGIKRICVSVSNLARSTAFFVEEMELEKVCSGSMNMEDVRKMYGLDNCKADYVMLKMMSNPRFFSSLNSQKKAEDAAEMAARAGITDIMMSLSEQRTTQEKRNVLRSSATAITARRQDMLQTG